MVPTRLRTGVTGVYGATMTTLTCIPATHVSVQAGPVDIHAREGRIAEARDEGLLRRQDRGGLCRAPERSGRSRIDARDPGELACRLGDAVVHVDRAAEVEDGHHQHQEDREGEGELDQRLAATPLTSAHQLVTVTVTDDVLRAAQIRGREFDGVVPSLGVDVVRRALARREAAAVTEVPRPDVVAAGCRHVDRVIGGVELGDVLPAAHRTDREDRDRHRADRCWHGPPG